MDTLIIVKSNAMRYYIYNAKGKCVAVARTKHDVYSYLDSVLSTYDFTSYVFTATASSSAFIVSYI